MEEKPRTIFANSINFGLMTGGAMIIFSLLMFLLDMHLNRAVSWIGYVFLIAGMAYGTLDFRKKAGNGYLTYGKAFTSCFLIGLFAGILSTIYFYIFVEFIHPGIIGEILDKTRAGIVESNPNMSEEDVERAVEMSAKFMTGPMMAVWGLVGNLVASSIFGLLVAIFLKKEDPSLKAQI